MHPASSGDHIDHASSFQFPASKTDKKSDIKQNERTIDVLKKMLAVMQIFSVTHLACGANIPANPIPQPRPSSTSTTGNSMSLVKFEKNTLKKIENHWG